MSDEPFGFAVTKVTTKSDYSTWPVKKIPIDPPNFMVTLPHQCDFWEIVGWDDGQSQGQALQQLDTFIAEAQAARAALARGEEFGDGQ